MDDDSSVAEEERLVDEGTVKDVLSVMDEEATDEDDEEDKGNVVDKSPGVDEEAEDMDDEMDERSVKDEETVAPEETSVVDEDSEPVDDRVPDEGVGARYTLPGYFPPKVRFTTLHTHLTCFSHLFITTLLPLLPRDLKHLFPRSTTSLTTYTHLGGLMETREGVAVCGGEGTGSRVLGEGTSLGGRGGSARVRMCFFIPSGCPHTGQASTVRCAVGEAEVLRGGGGGGDGGQFGGGVGRPPRLYRLNLLCCR